MQERVKAVVLLPVPGAVLLPAPGAVLAPVLGSAKPPVKQAVPEGVAVPASLWLPKASS